MGHQRHGCARTTPVIRRAIQESHESLRTLAARYAINLKTVAKWKQRTFVDDLPMGRQSPHSTVLTREQEAACVAVRKHTLLPLDDCLAVLQPRIPHLTRSSLHRCFERHGISRLHEISGDKPTKKQVKPDALGLFRLDIAEMPTDTDRLYLFVAIDWTSKFAYVEMLERLDSQASAHCLRNLIHAVPYHIQTVLTNNNSYSTNRNRTSDAIGNVFSTVCQEHGIEQRLIAPHNPWTESQVERMNRMLQAATLRRSSYESHQEIREQLKSFVTAYNVTTRLNTLHGLTPDEFIMMCWQHVPERFRIDPALHTSELRSRTIGN